MEKVEEGWEHKNASKQKDDDKQKMDGDISNDVPVEDEPSRVGTLHRKNSKKDNEMEISPASPTFPPEPDYSSRHANHKDRQPGQGMGGGWPVPVIDMFRGIDTIH